VLADYCSTLNKWKKHLSQLLKADSVSDVRQIQIHASELLELDPSSPFEVEIAIAKLKKYKFSGNDQLLAELIQAGYETLWFEINK
jgi:hypothetical protein